ncbi:hypothetical protein EVB27_083 [Rhizobium phage RHph_TM16]|nr:hypothetical protein EVB27_083 [Rhizobium phage RHph_TM16]
MSHKVDTLKSQGHAYGAGALARCLNEPRSYGCHFGMRSTLEKDRAAFFKGWDDADAEKKRIAASVTTVVFRVKGGDVYEQPVQGVARYWHAVRVALQFHGLRVSDVILCR